MLHFGNISIMLMEAVVESKNERFRRLADSRGERLRREIRLIGNLANTKNYEFDQDDINALFGPIDQAIDEVKFLFEKAVQKEKGE